MTILELVLAAVLVMQSLAWLITDFVRFDPKGR